MAHNPEPILPQVIDSTMLAAYRACPQKFFLEFILGLHGQETSIHLHAGACFASALEHFYEGIYLHKREPEPALSLSYLKYLQEWGDFTSTKPTPKTKENVWLAVEHYLHTYPPHKDHIQPYIDQGKPTIEFTFAIPLDLPNWPRHPSGDPFIYAGRFDLLGHYKGFPLPLDNKTASALGSTWAEQWDLRGQFIGYCWACQQLGYGDVNNVAVRGTAILKNEIKQAETICTYNNYLIYEVWLPQLRRSLEGILHSWESNWWDFNLADACTSYGGCQFKGICSTREFYQNALSRYHIRRWDPLRKNPLVELEQDKESQPLQVEWNSEVEIPLEEAFFYAK